MATEPTAPAATRTAAETPDLRSKPTDATLIQAKVYSPFHVYFDEAAKSISGENDTGAFDILPQHHNFITLLKAGELIMQTTHGEQRIRTSGGIMHVHDNQVVVFLDV
jgi:F0F1-type ATP synthase epsilon subunit